MNTQEMFVIPNQKHSKIDNYENTPNAKNLKSNLSKTWIGKS